MSARTFFLGCAATLALPAMLLSGTPDPGIFLQPERWNKNTSGEMTISRDETENAVRFDIDFKTAKDPWFYPFIRLEPGESFDADKVLQFDYKVQVTEGTPGFKFGFIWMVDAGNRDFKPPFRTSLPVTDGEWCTATMPLVSKTMTDPAAIRIIRIGANPNATGGKVSAWIRNVRFPDAATFYQMNAEKLSKALSNPKNWQPNTSGKMTISGTDGGVRFAVDFSAAKDPWLYPRFNLTDDLTLNGIKALEFEARVRPADAPVKLAYLMLNRPEPNFNPKAWIPYTRPNGEWQKITILLSHKEKGTATSFNLGINTSVKKHHIRTSQSESGSGTLNFSGSGRRFRRPDVTDRH